MTKKLYEAQEGLMNVWEVLKKSTSEYVCVRLLKSSDAFSKLRLPAAQSCCGKTCNICIFQKVTL